MGGGGGDAGGRVLRHGNGPCAGALRDAVTAVYPAPGPLGSTSPLPHGLLVTIARPRSRNAADSFPLLAVASASANSPALAKRSSTRLASAMASTTSTSG